jgi:hypothetical protein
MKQYTVRYGRVYKIVIAMVLPSLSIVPFIWLMRLYAPASELDQYLIIFSFLAVLILFSIWVVLRIYPKATLYIDKKEITLCFNGPGFLKPDDFSVPIHDITYLSPANIVGNDYIVFKTKNPSRKFQLSAPSYKLQEYQEFNIAMNEIREMMILQKDKD